MVYWCLGDSVMNLLYDNGNFGHILIQIYFELSPSDLLNCSLVCKKWKAFLDEQVFNVGRGHARRRRIMHNWMHGVPNTSSIRVNSVRHVTSRSRDEVDVNVAGVGGPGVGLLLPYGSRNDIVRALLADAADVVVATLRSVDVHDRKSGHIRLKLFSSQMDLSWVLAMSERFLVGKVKSANVSDKRLLHVWDRQSGYPKLPVGQIPLQAGEQPARLHSVGTDGDTFLCEVAHRPVLYALRINVDRMELELMWRLRIGYDLLDVSAAEKVILCGRDISGGFALSLLNAADGSSLLGNSPFRFDASDEEVVKGVAFTQPVGVVVVSRTEEQLADGWMQFRIVSSKMLLVDLANRCVVRSVDFDCGSCFGAELNNCCLRLWCDPPIGTLLMAVRGTNTASNRFVAWNMLDLLRGDEDCTTPDRVFDAGCYVHADVIVPSMHKVLHAGSDGRVVDCEFWGDLKQ